MICHPFPLTVPYYAAFFFAAVTGAANHFPYACPFAAQRAERFLDRRTASLPFPTRNGRRVQLLSAGDLRDFVILRGRAQQDSFCRVEKRVTFGP